MYINIHYAQELVNCIHLCLSVTECVLGEDRFYIVSPIDILLAQKRDVADHIDWLLLRKDFEVQRILE